ncbi:MAG: uroporphyrinogen-III C-methyltransferase [Candidatus Aureabacteria bacterium]|nr:uroporphyrinogen-III C-methyltransferase [Candidatus Auribacterota bacterium]
MKSSGKVYLVGAGPGDPGLITEKGRSILALADVILYDHLANPSLLLSAREDAERISVGKIGGRKNIPQKEINRLLVRNAQRGKIVVRLKGGDPILFGRGAEELLHLLRNRIACEVVPGVSAALAVPSCAGIPLTMRGVSSSVTILTGHEADLEDRNGVDWKNLLKADSTFVVLMGVRNLAEIVRRFLAAGKSPLLPAALVENGTTPRERVITAPLARIAHIARQRRITAPAILVVGKAVSLRKKVSRRAAVPLRGVRVLVTRPYAQAEGIVKLLERCGAIPYVNPLIRIRPARSFAPLDKEIRRVRGYGWIIFTSVNAVRAFMGRLHLRNLDARALAGVRICAIGGATEAELRRWGVRAECVPPSFTTAAIVRKLSSRGEVKGRSFLLPRSDLAGRELPDALARLGGRCVEVHAYRTVISERILRELGTLITKERIDFILLTSPSIAEGYARMLKKISAEKFHAPLCAAIGPVTAMAARTLGLKVAVEAKQHTDEGLVAAIVHYWKRKQAHRIGSVPV